MTKRTVKLKLDQRTVTQAFLSLVLAVIFSGCAAEKAGGDAADLITSGWHSYQLGEFKMAAADFQSARDMSDPGSDDWTRATYALATTWSLRRPGEDEALAERLFNELLEEAPDHDLAAWSGLALARMKHLVPVGQDPDYDEVRARYRKVIDRYAGHLAADEAFLYLQSTYVAQMDKENAKKALVALKDFLKRRPDSGLVSACYSLVGTCYELLDEPVRRLEAELKAFETAEVDPTNPYQDNAWNYWYLAVIAEFDAGDFASARKYYRLLIEEYPTDIRVYSATQAIKRMDEIEAGIRAELEKKS
ncbi:MAG: tetratricopeptide repeat protein [Verrucomicrobia bacterium]|nr:tetratricopeptide repeat protein [Verrucomicrobiota bacterium]